MSQNNAVQSRRGDRLYYDKLYSQLFSSTIDMCFIISCHFLHLCLCFLLYKLRMPTSIKDTIDWSFANETAKKLNRQHTSEVQRNKIKYTTNEMSPNIDLGNNYLELKKQTVWATKNNYSRPYMSGRNYMQPVQNWHTYLFQFSSRQCCLCEPALNRATQDRLHRPRLRASCFTPRLRRLGYACLEVTDAQEICQDLPPRTSTDCSSTGHG